MRNRATLPKGVVFVAAGIAVAATIVVWTGGVGAYEQYSTNRANNCADAGCHGDFNNGLQYVSKSDGVAWVNPGSGNDDLHDSHRYGMLAPQTGSQCSICHQSGGRFPVALNLSVGITGYSAIACLGCHGRDEGGQVTGKGLRQHHFRGGVTLCGNAGCHTDADPASGAAVGENVAPPYYFADANFPNKPVSPCNTDGKESLVAPPRGLDNDGDSTGSPNNYDAADTDCSTTPIEETTWGKIKSIYR